MGKSSSRIFVGLFSWKNLQEGTERDNINPVLQWLVSRPQLILIIPFLSYWFQGSLTLWTSACLDGLPGRVIQIISSRSEFLNTMPSSGCCTCAFTITIGSEDIKSAPENYLSAKHALTALLWNINLISSWWSESNIPAGIVISFHACWSLDTICSEWLCGSYSLKFNFPLDVSPLEVFPLSEPDLHLQIVEFLFRKHKFPNLVIGRNDKWTTLISTSRFLNNHQDLGCILHPRILFLLHIVFSHF